MNRVIPGIVILLFIHVKVFSQSNETQGWFFLSHSQKISKKWDFLADVQLRGAEKLKRVETILLRGAFSYNFNDAHSAAIGYAHKGDWEETNYELNYQPEHRIYQQYLYNHTIKRIEFTARGRLEQRFVKEEEKFKFSQRLRAFLSFQIPLAADKNFSKGLYTTLQNELFVNVQNKENVNNSFFDQNRPFISLGYRWSKKIDTEIGYMYWRQKQEATTATTNVVQLMVTTNL